MLYRLLLTTVGSLLLLYSDNCYGNVMQRATTTSTTVTSNPANPTGIVADKSTGATILYTIGYEDKQIHKYNTQSNAYSVLSGKTTLGRVDGNLATAQFDKLISIEITYEPGDNPILWVGNQRSTRLIRKIDIVGNQVTTATGGGWGHVDGPLSVAMFKEIRAITAKPEVTTTPILYIGENSGFIRKVDLSAGLVTSVVGTGTSGCVDGPFATAQIQGGLYDMVINSDGNTLYFVVGDNSNNVRRLDLSTQIASTISGTSYGSADGPAPTAKLLKPKGIEFISTASGSALYIATRQKLKILDLSSMMVTSVGGNSYGSVDGLGNTILFNDLTGITVDPVSSQLKVYLTSTAEDEVRMLAAPGVTPVSPYSSLTPETFFLPASCIVHPKKGYSCT